MQTIRFKQLVLRDHDFPDLEETLRYWSLKKEQSGQGVVAPSWADFNMLDLPPGLLPRICVVDVIAEEPLDFRYRYWGTAITGLHHYDLSGKSVMNLTPPEYAQCIRDQYFQVCSTKQPLTFLTEIPLDSGYFSYYAAMRLPLSSDGENIDKVLSAEEFGQDRNDLKKFLDLPE